VPDDEYLRRIDAHMARGNEIMQRGNEIMQRSTEIMQRSNEVIEANRRTFEDWRTFLREMTLRQERVLGRLAATIDEQIEMLREQRREFVEEIREQRREFVEESRAQRAALFRILDRLDGGGEATAGA
jgi:DNA primase large subunit